MGCAESRKAPTAPKQVKRQGGRDLSAKPIREPHVPATSVSGSVDLPGPCSEFLAVHCLFDILLEEGTLDDSELPKGLDRLIAEASKAEVPKQTLKQLSSQTKALRRLYAEKSQRRHRAPFALLLKEARELRDRHGALASNGRAAKTDLEGVLEVAMGRFDNLKRVYDKRATSKRVRVFTSSTFTDTEMERTILMTDVYPYLSELCDTLGWRWEVVDMRWGVREQANDDHSTSELCMTELKRCLEQSAGPAFFTLLGNKSGYCPLPSHIDSEEFDQIIAKLGSNGDCDGVAVLRKWYKLNKNTIPPEYDLLRVSMVLSDFLSTTKEVQEIASSDWWTYFGQIQAALRRGAADLSEEQKSKYTRAVTGEEVRRGVLEHDVSDRVMVWMRDFTGLTCHEENAKNWMDVLQVDGKASEDPIGKELIFGLKRQVRNRKDLDYLHSVSIPWQASTGMAPRTIASHASYFQDFGDWFSTSVGDSILNAYEKNMEKMLDENTLEICQQMEFAQEKSANFVGRKDALDAIQQYIASDETTPFVVFGPSGIGKSSLMAKAAIDCDGSYPQSTVAIRFLGTTPQSATGHALLKSVCGQLRTVYGSPKNDEGKVLKAEDIKDSTFKALAASFHLFLALATEACPLILFLDSVDQLSDMDNARNTKVWLPKTLPPFVKVVVSTLPEEGECFASLKSLLQKDDKTIGFKVEPVTADVAETIVRDMLRSSKRNLTAAQFDELKSACTACPVPLFIEIAFDRAKTLPSYVKPISFPRSVQGIVGLLFHRLERVHGKQLIGAAVRYITVAKHGVSEAELEDLISCNDIVLSDVYQWWTPPRRRLPPLIWLRVRNDLGHYLAERGFRNTVVYSWFHRQFWEVAESHYLQGRFAKETHKHLAKYFGNEWEGGKSIEPEGTPVPRHLMPQSLWVEAHEGDAVRGTDQSQVNQAVVFELAHHQVLGGMWSGLSASLVSLEFVIASVLCGNFYGLVEEYGLAVKLMDEAAKRTSKSRHQLEEFASFMKKNPQILARRPTRDIVINVALSLPPTSEVRVQAEALASSSDSFYFKPVKEKHADACVLLNHLHKDGLTVGLFHPTEAVAITCADNAVVFDLTTGKQVVSYENVKDIEFACLTFDGKLVCCTSGEKLKVWETMTGKEVGSFEVNSRYSFSCIAPSPVSNMIAVSGPDGFLRTYDLDSMKMHHTFKGHKSDCDHVTWSPNGERICSSSDDKTARVWRVKNKNQKWCLTDHQDCVHASAFSPDGSFLVTCSSLETFVYSCETGKMTVKIGNGSHLPMISKSSESIFIQTHSSTQVMVYSAAGDVKGVLDGRECHEGAIATYAVSHNGQMFASGDSSGLICVWSLKNFELMGVCQGHSGSVSTIQFAPDDKTFLTTADDQTSRLWRPALLKTKKSKKQQLNQSRGSDEPDKGAALSQSFVGSSRSSISGPSPLESHESIQDSTFIPSTEYFLVLERKRVVLYDTTSGRGEREWPIVSGRAMDVNAAGLIAVSCTESVTILDARADSTVQTLKGHERTIDVVKYSPDGSLLATADAVIQIYRVSSLAKSSTPAFVLIGHDEEVTDLAVDPSNQWAASVAYDTLCLWDLASETGDRLVKKLKFEDDVSADCVSFTPSGDFLLVGCEQLHVYNPTNLAKIHVIKSIEGFYIPDISITPSSLYAVFTTGARQLVIAEIESGRLTVCSGFSEDVDIVRLSPDGTIAYGLSAIGELRAFAVPDGRLLWVHHSPTHKLCVSDTIVATTSKTSVAFYRKVVGAQLTP